MKKRLTALFVVVLLIVGSGVAQNPIITNIFTADPAAIVHNDTVFVYSGHDEAAATHNGYVMNDWQLATSSDMVNWTSHGEVLNVSAFSWASGDAWAGEVEERNGKFYFYICAEHKNGGKAVGVAVSDSPYGPFVDPIGKALITNDMTTAVSSTWDDIDPTVFVDTDGQAYMYWGNSGLYYIKLKENMIETEGSIVRITNLANFTEAPYIHKQGDIYYLSYAYGWPEQTAYATSSSIIGPWTYRGLLVDVAENCGTNHQSIIEFKGQSYFVYHTGAIGGDYRRSVAIDYLYYNADGTIPQVVPTATGVANVTQTATCKPSSLVNKLSVNSGAVQLKRKVDLVEGDNITLSPETTESGTWSWVGPNGFTANTPEVSLTSTTPDQSGLYMATFTNSCGTQSFMGYTLAIKNEVPSEMVTGHKYIIKPLVTDMVVSVQGGGVDDGADVVLENDVKGIHQRFQFNNVGGFYWSVLAGNSLTKGLDVYNFSQDNGGNVNIWNYWGGETQQWQIVRKREGVYNLIARHSGKCMAVNATLKTVFQWECSDVENQEFSLTDVATSSTENIVANSSLLQVYPVPAKSGQAVIDLSQIASPLSLELIDASGKQVYGVADPASVVTGFTLFAGVYLVKVSTTSTVYIQKLIVE